jgi:hypothetical protein
MKKIIILLTISFLFQSCATLLRQPSNKDIERVIHLSSEPSNAEVYIKNNKIGETPFDYTFKGRKAEKVTFKQEGYYDETTNIKRKLNPLWTVISVVGGIYPGLGIPIYIDHKNGSFYDIITDSIHFNLMSLTGGNNNSTAAINSSIVFPAMEIRTGQYKLKILPKTRARFHLKNGDKFGGLITAIYEDHFEIKKQGLFTRKGKQDVYFANMEKARFFKTRLWYPIITSPSIITPIVWYFCGKVAEFDSRKCKWDIKSMSIVEGIPEIRYGKVKCDKSWWDEKTDNL